MNDPIRFYGKSERYGWLSNFSPHPIEIEGELWPSSEFFYQTKKFTFLDRNIGYVVAVESAQNNQDFIDSALLLLSIFFHSGYRDTSAACPLARSTL